MNAGPGRARDPARAELAARALAMSKSMQQAVVAKRLGVTLSKLRHILADDRNRRLDVEATEPDEWPDTAERCRCGLRLPCSGCLSIYELASMGRGT